MSLDMMHRSELAYGLKLLRPLQLILLTDSQEEKSSTTEKKENDGQIKPIVARTFLDPAITDPNYDLLPILGSQNKWLSNGGKE